MKGNMRILFIDQPSQSLGLHNGLASLAAMLSGKPCEVSVLDLRNVNIKADTAGFVKMPECIDYGYLRTVIGRFAPDVIGVSVRSTFFRQSQELIAFLKTNYHQITVIAGGSHLSIDGLDFMNETMTDIGVIGEAEYTIQDLYEYFSGSRKLESINGIAYRDNGKIVMSPQNEFVKDLDSIPFPVYDGFTSVIANNGIIPSYPIVTSRGCPYSCTFCLSPIVSGKKWRMRSPRSVLEEINYARKKYKIKRVNFMEDNFNLDLKRAKEILKLMAEEAGDLIIDFLAGVRADMIDDEFIDLIKRARVQSIAIGVESIDSDVRNILRKGVSLEKTIESINKVRNADINTQIFLIIGLPGSTYEKDIRSIEVARQLGINTYWTIANAYPKTEMYEWVKRNGRILSDYKDASMTFIDEGSLNFDTEYYPVKKRIEVFERALIATRRFDRLIYSRRGLRAHFDVTRLVFKYEKKAAIIYQIHACFVFLRSVLLKMNLYHKIVKMLTPRMRKWILFWKNM
ncbi:MAG: radical SAM protein [Deltaproteobacteria bacterium]|nr:radical SAM protein [Deltaproteobacteria bacterium]